MNELNKNQKASLLVQSVVALDTHFSELIRLGVKIEELGMKSDSDFDQAEKLMKHFSEHGEGVAREVVAMSQALQIAREQAENAAKLVGDKAELLQARRADEQGKMKQFTLLGDKVRELTISLSEFKKPAEEMQKPEERAQMMNRLSQFELELKPLIEEASQLKKDAQLTKMRTLEQGADSLGQSLLAVQKRLGQFHSLN